VGGGFRPGLIKEQNSIACASRRGTGCPGMSFPGGNGEQGVREQTSSDVAG
jgi:hypothetical protein